MPTGKTERCVLVGLAMALALGVGAAPACAKPRLPQIGWPFNKTSKNELGIENQQTGRYQSDDGVTFVLDLTTPEPLLRFDGSPEIWVLHRQRISRGDTVYQDDVGQVVIRQTSIGGMILFDRTRSGGAPVAAVGRAPLLRLPVSMSPQVFVRALAQASFRAGRIAKHVIPFEANDVTRGAEPIYVDCAVVTVEAVSRMAERKNGLVVLRKVQRVQFIPGAKVGASMDGQVLKVRLNPGKGVAGRPSSRKIMSAIR